MFKFLSRVHPKFKTPVNATLLSGLTFGLMAAVFNLDVLMDFMSIGTLLAYTMVSACVIILRYKQVAHRSLYTKSPLKTYFQTDADILFAKERQIEIVEVTVSCESHPAVHGLDIFRPDSGSRFSTREVPLCQTPPHQVWLPWLLFSLVKLNWVSSDRLKSKS